MRLAALVAIAAIAAGATVGGLHAQSDSGDAYVVYRAVAVVTREGLPTVVPDIVVDEGPTPWIWPETLRPEELTEVLRAAGWPEHLLGEASRVTWCESRWKPEAVNWGDQKDGLGSTGLFQLWSGWYAAAGESYEDWRDPVVNARVALYAYRTSGWEPWSCRP